VVNMTPQPLYARDRTAVSGLGVPHSWSSRSEEEKNVSPMPGIQIPNRPARSLASVPTTL